MKENMMRVTVAAVIVMTILSSTVVAEENFKGLDSTTNRAITRRLQGLREFIDAKYDQKATLRWIKSLGFDSPDELLKVRIDTAFPLYEVPPGKLRTYEKGDDPFWLLEKTNGYIYPLLVDKVARSSAKVFLQDKSTNEKSTIRIELGDSQLIRRLFEARQQLQNEGHCSRPSECFAVTVPELSLHLFGHRREELADFSIVVLNRVPGHVRKEDFHEAKEVFEEMSNDMRKRAYRGPSHTPSREKQLMPKP
jgi:hypothetical protein